MIIRQRLHDGGRADVANVMDSVRVEVHQHSARSPVAGLGAFSGRNLSGHPAKSLLARIKRTGSICAWMSPFTAAPQRQPRSALTNLEVPGTLTRIISAAPVKLSSNKVPKVRKLPSRTQAAAAEASIVIERSKTEMASTAIFGNSIATRYCTFHVVAHALNLYLIQLSSTNTELSSTTNTERSSTCCWRPIKMRGRLILVVLVLSWKVARKGTRNRHSPGVGCRNYLNHARSLS